jgi:hypothetical protein
LGPGGELPDCFGGRVESGGVFKTVPVKETAGAKPTFEAGAPVTLFDAHMVNSGSAVIFEYDVTAEGKRFLINVENASGAASPPLTVVTNWQAGLKK